MPVSATPARRSRHHHAVGVDRRGQACVITTVVRPVDATPHGSGDPGLGRQIQVRGGFVEQDRRVHEVGPGEREQLALTGGQPAPLRGEAAPGTRPTACGLSWWAPTARAAASTSAVPRVGSAVRDVVAHRPGEEVRLLGTTPSWRRYVPRSRVRTSCPSTKTAPLVTS